MFSNGEPVVITYGSALVQAATGSWGMTSQTMKNQRPHVRHVGTSIKGLVNSYEEFVYVNLILILCTDRQNMELDVERVKVRKLCFYSSNFTNV